MHSAARVRLNGPATVIRKIHEYFNGYKNAYGVADLITRFKTDPETGKRNLYTGELEELTDEIYKQHQMVNYLWYTTMYRRLRS